MAKSTSENDPKLLNPNGRLFPEIEERLFFARKNKPLWARRLEQDQMVTSREGQHQAKAGDYLCRGIEKEQWPQTAEKLLEKYTPAGEPDSDGWQRFEPKPEAAAVQAAQIDYSFRVVAHWGQLTGRAGDYLVRSTTDPTDIWIVGKDVFEASYQRSN